MAESNFNMVRVWGGGYYPDDIFYDVCDELGIMVWQDLMFACAMYPGDSSFLNNVEDEFEYQIPRIASHPSLTLFNGNNEVDVAWKNWGFQAKFGIYGDDAKQVENDYNKLFKQLAPKVISSYTNSPYVHTSPLSNWGKDEFYNHGTMHYWGVWHGKDPIEDFGKKSGRFNAEYGFQSFPEFSTMHTFSEKKDWDLDSLVMKHHQKSYVGNGMILKQATILYGKPKTFDEFVYFSQLTQSKAVSIAIAGHRVGMPRCMGTLYWQVNDCWQAPTWSSVDYFGNWKALQYSVRKDYEDVAIVSKIEELGKEEYYIVSDSPKEFVCQLKYTTYNLNGKHEQTNSISIPLKQGTVEKVCPECLIKEARNKNYVIHFEWKDANGESKERWISHISKELKKASEKDIKF
jgi:beta-mannosidase